MSDAIVSESSPPGGREAPARRAFVVGDEAATGALAAQLAARGYEVQSAAPSNAPRAIRDFSPGVVLFAFGEREGEGALISLARRLRAAAATYITPLVFLYRTDARALRGAALNIGVDDYFPLGTPAAEVWARLDALIWRAAAGRRAAPAAGDQRAEIDNFLLLLDAVSADAQRPEGIGAVALARAVGEGGEGGDESQARLLAEAYGFLKLNLRRADGVAFYGPAVLLVYLPRVDAATARASLERLREEFVAARHGVDLFVGLASFPEDGREVEGLIEKAEAALTAARAHRAGAHVLRFESQDGGAASSSRSQTSGAARVAGEGTPGAARAFSVETGASRGAGAEEGSRGPAGATAHERTWGAGGGAGPRRLLLAVSDAARMAQINLLLRSASYEVRAAFDGQQALSLLRIDRPDALVLDYELKDMDGVEMLRRLRGQSGGRLGVPVLLLLPAVHETAGRDALGIGARKIITLPYDPVELLDSVREFGSVE